MKKPCQSCASPLKQGKADIRGTNLDGSRSDVYCNRCYLNGKFVEPDLTYDQMLDRCMTAIKSQKMNPVARWMITKSYPTLLKKCSRWT